ncbi:hypothetical protein CKO38_08840 [Rhodospirillum rubrum]|uniref:hypothetical protein n=1 Tax=Rhodospirillum rubrum TaxID=1085 RepID=UPI0019043645|nr:hypothetical protein [Rhodospirillum rubrum]MBK1664329.1 hypothetical protein [Rhodospirillum rubrum]MBK1676774.1 hypothetical protein [Rhodospirillum rubrum]
MSPPRRPITRLWILGLIALALSVLAEVPVGHAGHFGFDGLFAFNAWFGFLACVALVVIAKLLGSVLKRGEDYYGD